jgi:hypothetical protein
VNTGRRSPIDDNAVRRLNRNHATAIMNVAVKTVPCVLRIIA